MVSKNQKKLIKSLSRKKYRKQHGLFVAEGKKVIRELLDASLELHTLYTTEGVSFGTDEALTYEVTEEELQQMSFLTTSQAALAVFHIPVVKEIEECSLIVALDAIKDPGNLGTIIRLCDWFGITDIVCGEGTVDCYNPKVIQATMGSITRVNITYLDLVKFIKEKNQNLPVFGTYIRGESIYEKSLPDQGILIMGNEAHGISEAMSTLIHHKITIPQFDKEIKTESLNVATATAIILSEFRRK